MTFSDYPIFENKNGYLEELVNLIFTPNDFIVEQRNEYTFKGFHQTAKNCKQRLEIYGFTLSKAKEDFNNAKQFSKVEEFYNFPINKITYDKYLEEIKVIIKNKETEYDQLFTNFKDSLITLDLGIHGQSKKGHIYSILSVLPDDAIIEYDLTDVIYGGWVKESNVRKINFEKIIILTEGKTDVEFISGSLIKLYPHLYDYYQFLDFDSYKPESNASGLVKLVIVLAAANIKHPIIVLFDNDTSGIMEMNKLIKIKLPINFKILKYPDLKFAKKYPTIGPTGIKEMNINGYACGIEMYLGQKSLTKDGQLIPIKWKGYNDKENKYQGEIADKIYVQDKFKEKLKKNIQEDFSDINLILKEIFSAFNL